MGAENRERVRASVCVCVCEIEKSLCQIFKIILKSVNNKVLADVNNDKRVFRSRGKKCI